MNALPSSATQEIQSTVSEPAFLNARRRALALEAGVSVRHLAKLSGQTPLTETRCMELVRAFAACQEEWCLTLLGHHGVGKTFAGEWLLVQSIARDERAQKIITPCDLREVARVPDQRQTLQKKGLLMVDDLGCESIGSMDAFRAQLFELVNYRWRFAKKTVFTSNLSPAAFLRRYGRGVTDRICDKGRCVAVTGPNLRN